MDKPCNPIWNYFHRNESSATCVVCRKELSLGSVIPRIQTLSNIKKHLEKLHQHEYTAFQGLEKEYLQHKSANVNLKRRAKRKRLKERKEALEGPKERKKAGRKRKLKNEEFSESEHTSLNIEIVLEDPIVEQDYDDQLEEIDETNIIIGHKRSPLKSNDIALTRRIDKSVLDLMIVDLLPFNIVEGLAFQRLHLTDPSKSSRYVVKPMDYYKNNLLPETYDSVKKKVMLCLEQAEWISLTTSQCWSTKRSCCIHVIAGHFLQENQRHMVALQILPFDSKKDLPNLLDLTRKFNIVDKIHLNVVKKNDDASSEWFTTLECSEHLLQRVIQESIFVGEVIDAIIRKSHSITRHFETNKQAMQNLHECQEICGSTREQLLTAYNESWSSTYLMWERLIEQKPALELYKQQYGDIQVLSDFEWQQIEYLVQILKMFYQAWLDLKCEAASVSLIIPLLTMLNSKLENKLTDPQDLTYYKKTLKSHLNQYFDFARQSSSLIISTLLDPRFKMRYLSEQQLSSCHSEMTHNLRLSLNLEEQTQNPSYDALPSNNYNYHNTADLWESHDTSTIIESNTTESVLLAFEQQLSFYLKEPLIARNGNMYQYWNLTPYEYLRKLAYKYLTAPPTSLTFNETLCQMSSLYSERRLALQDENDEKLLFMSCNIKLFNFEY